MTSSTTYSTAHTWRFFRSGGFDQVSLETADDLRHLEHLDPKLWTALACPTTGLEFDPRTLALIDTDNDGHIRVPEVLAAVKWACAMLKDPVGLFAGGALPLAAIDDRHADGAELLATARQALAYLGKTGAKTLAVEDFTDMTLLFQAEHVNGDGVVPPALAGDAGDEGEDTLRQLVADIVATQGGVADRSGEPGATAETLVAFMEQAQAVQAWRARAESEAAALMPLGAATADAVAAVAAVRAKVDDFFTRCGLAAYDARAAEALNPALTAYAALAEQAMAAGDAAVAALPLATVAASAALPLHGDAGLNPAWAGAVVALGKQAVAPLLGARDELTAADWAALQDKLAAHAAWQAERPATAVHDLDSDRLAALLAGDAPARLATLIEQDATSHTSATRVDAAQRLVHYQRDLVTLLHNFVTLSDFYSRTKKAIFQAGTLYIDQRSCELVLRVGDAAAHAKMAPFSGCYLLYCVCERSGSAPIHIVAALTGGSVDELMVPGRHGVFYDRDGRDWMATVSKVVEQPVSVRQAFFAPYRRIGSFVENQIRNFAASKDKAVEAKAQAGVVAAGGVGGVGAAGAPAASAASAATPPFDIARFAGIFAAIGLAVGALGTALAAAISGLFLLAWWQLPLVLVLVLLAISAPSMVLAWLTLRRRNLGPLLDANGWAVNARARINIAFGGALTAVATLPQGAKRSMTDPYADKKNPWPFWLGVLAVLLLALWLTRGGVSLMLGL